MSSVDGEKLLEGIPRRHDRVVRRFVRAGAFTVGLALAAPALATDVDGLERSVGYGMDIRVLIDQMLPGQTPHVFKDPEEIPLFVSGTRIQCRGWVPGLGDEFVYSPKGETPERTMSIGCLENWKNRSWSGIKIADRTQFSSGPIIRVGCPIDSRNCISPKKVKRVISEKHNGVPGINVVLCSDQRPAKFIQVAPKILIDPQCAGYRTSRSSGKPPEFIKVFCKGKDAPPEYVRLRSKTRFPNVCLAKFSWFNLQFEVRRDEESGRWVRKTPRYSYGDASECWTTSC